MKPMQEVLSSRLADALGWTLLHSLWQGALLALMLAVALLWMNRRSAQARYFTATGMLFTMLLSGAATFCFLYFSPRTAKETIVYQDVVQVPTAVAAKPSPVAAQVLSVVPSPSAWEAVSGTFTEYFEQHTPLFVTVWLLGVLVLTLRLLGGLAYVQRLKNYQTRAIDADWLQRTQQLATQIRLTRPVRVLESALVRVPVAIGYFKPVILLPVGTFTGLSPQQAEAVLAHELAHLLRNDYWVNIGQSVVEILFFFHPAVWWMSGVVRQEREHCCDDIAVQTCGDNLTFAQALTRLEVLQTTPTLALAADGGSLLVRIRRLLNQSPQKPGFAEGLLVAGVLLFCLATISASAFASLNHKNTVQNSPFTQNTPSDSIAGTETVYATFTDTAQVVREIIIVKDKKGHVTEVRVDGKKLSKEEMKNYESVIAQKLKTPRRTWTSVDETDIADIEAGIDIETPFMPPVPPAPLAPMAPFPPVAPPPFDFDVDKNASDENTQRIQKEMARLDEQRRKLEEKQQRIFEKFNEKHQSEMEELMEKQQQEIEKQQEEVSRQMEKLQEEIDQQQETNLKNLERELEWSRDAHEKSMKLHKQNLKAHEQNMEQHERNMALHEQQLEAHAKAMEKHEKFMKKLVGELKKDGIIKNERGYRIKLKKNGLYVDGKKQPDAVFQKYKALIKKETGEDIDKWGDNQNMEFSSEYNSDEDQSRLKKRQPLLFDWMPLIYPNAVEKAEEGC